MPPPNGPLLLPPLDWAVVNPMGEIVSLCRSWELAVEILGNRPTAAGWRVVLVRDQRERAQSTHTKPGTAAGHS